MERTWLVVEKAKVHVMTGLVLDATGVPVKLTCYLRTSLNNGLEPVPLPEKSELFKQPLIVGYNNGSRLNYYHWLIQCLFPAWLWARSQTHSDALFLTPRLVGMQQQSWRFSRVAARCHYQGSTNALLSVPRAIVIPEAFAPGAHDPSPLLGDFAQDVSNQISGSTNMAGAAIYVSRRDSTKRPLGNEAELESALTELGFCVVTLSERSFQDQVRLFRSAKLIVSPHGAGLANVIFCQPGTRVVELMPSVRVNRCFERLSAMIAGVQHEVRLLSATGTPSSLEWRVDAPSLARSIAEDLRRF